MIKLNGKITDDNNFFGNRNPFELMDTYGSPLYVYNERILRTRCREMKELVSYPHFKVQFSSKSNANFFVIKIAREEGLLVEATSPGEIYVQLEAGYKPHEIFYVCNNVSEEDMSYAVDRGVLVSADSLSQLERLGRVNTGGRVAVRFNPGVGDGHHEKVVTAGEHTKFAVSPKDIPQVKEILKKYQLKLVGLNQHIGSLFMEGTSFMQSSHNLKEVAMQFEDLEFIDLGGGFGIPYRKQENQPRLGLKELGQQLSEFMFNFSKDYGKDLTFITEPGRYITAECGVILGTVHSVKYNENEKYIGTDVGMNVLLRPAMYNAHHDIEVYRKEKHGHESESTEKVTIVGNICESGDILGDYELPEIKEGDCIAVLDAGAYGHVMSSNYNYRMRPAEVLIREDNSDVLIRERDTFEDIMKKFCIC